MLVVLAAAVLGLDLVLRTPWLSALIVGGLAVLFGAALLALGKSRMTHLTPERSLRSLRRDTELVQEHRAIIQSSAETVRDGLRSRARSTVATLKRHPVPIGIAAVLVGARLGLRPSAADRDRRRAQQDLERVFDVLGVAFERTKERSQVEASRLVDLGRDAVNHPGRYAAPALRAAERLGRMSRERTVRTLQRAAEESRAVSQAIRREAGSYPLGALVVFGVAAGGGDTRDARSSRLA